MNKTIRLGVFAVVAIAQVVAPAQMILSRESVLKHGAQYRFRTRPVDPYDAFRGRYVQLSVDGATVPFPSGDGPTYGETVYVTLGKNADGIAKLTQAFREPPAQGDYIRAKAGMMDDTQHVLNVNLPIDRYYMEEWNAPAAERAYRENSGTNAGNTYVTVRVYRGEVVVEGLFIGDVPIEEYLRQNPELKGGNKP